MNKKRVFSYIVVLTLLGILMLPMIVVAGDVPPFNIDGVVPDSEASHLDDPEGNEKELGAMNSSTTKLAVIDDDVPPTLDYTNPNGQVDFADVWIDTVEDAGGDIWFYFGWMRDSKHGSGVIGIELGSEAPPPACDYSLIGTEDEALLIANCNPWENRATGDTLFLWDQQGNNLVIQKRTFDDDNDTWGPTEDLDPNIAVAAYSEDGFYGEVAINLTKAIFNPGECLSIGNIIPGTLTGNSDTADYKDTVLGDTGIRISNCGSIKIIKQDDDTPPNRLNDVDFNLYQSDGDGNFEPGTEDAFVASCTTMHIGNGLGEDGVCLLGNLLEDYSYWVLEDTSTLPYGYDPPVPPYQLASVSANATTVVTFTNPRQRGSIIIEKVVKGTSDRIDGAAFALDGDGDPDTTLDQTPILSVDGQTGLFCVDDLLFGEYHVVETTVPTHYEAETEVQSFTVGAKSDCSDAASRSADLTFENEAQPSLTTSATAAVTVGGVIMDTATLANGYNPQGTITFALYDNNACTGTPLFSGSVDVTGNGSYSSESYTTDAAGTYYWLASYSGDGSNAPASHACGADGEVTVVNKESPAFSTLAVTGVTVGAAISDSATLSGGFNPTGTISFELYYNDETCSGDPVFDPVVTVDGNASYSSGDYTTSAAGTYYWMASYSGDDNNEPAGHACNVAGEISVVNPAQPSISTAPRLLPNDFATISGLFIPAGVTDLGTITFELYPTADCSGVAMYTEPAQTVTGNGTYNTHNTSVFITADGTYSWYVGYSGDGNNYSAFSYCDAEQQVIDFTPLK